MFRRAPPAPAFYYLPLETPFDITKLYRLVLFS